MRIERLKDDAQARFCWDEFVSESNNGTVFHKQQFLGYHPEERFEDHHLAVYKRDRLYAVITGAIVENRDAKAFVSHPGASYGGVVLGSHCRFEDAAAVITALVTYLRETDTGVIDLTLPPAPYYQVPHQTLEYALVSAGFQYRKRELTSVVAIDAGPDSLYARLPKKTRADVRQAQKLGLGVNWIDDPPDYELSVMYDMLLENREELGLLTPPAHTIEELGRIRDQLPGMLLMGLVRSEDRPVASTLVFRCNSRVLLTFYICHKSAARDRHPVHLMLHGLLCEGAKQGYRYVDFGISTVQMKPLYSLIKFKESFGAQGFFRDTFEKHI